MKSRAGFVSTCLSEPRPTGVGPRPVGQVPDLPSGDVFESVDVQCLSDQRSSAAKHSFPILPTEPRPQEAVL